MIETFFSVTDPANCLATAFETQIIFTEQKWMNPRYNNHPKGNSPNISRMCHTCGTPAILAAAAPDKTVAVFECTMSGRNCRNILANRQEELTKRFESTRADITALQFTRETTARSRWMIT